MNNIKITEQPPMEQDHNLINCSRNSSLLLRRHPILRTINTLETLFASASACATSTSTSNASPRTTASKGLALLDTTFASATPSRRQRPVAHHVSTEPFPPPPSVPPSTRLAYATAHLRSHISSEPESSDPPSPTSCHAAAQLIHSPQPTNSQLPQILTQGVISALLGMPPSRTSSVASSRYEGDIESSDDLHKADSPVNERPQTHASRTRKHELGDVTPRPPLRGFASSEKVPSFRTICFANCGIIYPICTSTFGTHPKCSGDCP